MSSQRTPMIADLWDHLDDAAVQALVADHHDGDVAGFTLDYRRTRSTRALLGLWLEGSIVGIVGARMALPGVCEVLDLVVEPTHRGHGLGSMLVDAGADRLHAVTIWAEVPPSTVEFWRRLGFAVKPSRRREGAIWVERRHPAEPDGFRADARVTVEAARTLTIELPPEGNTLPLPPDAAVGAELPAWVTSWILEAEEVGLMLQELDPVSFPPVTPAVRPDSIRDALGPVAHLVGADPSVDDLADEALLPGLPVGVQMPVRIVELIACAERIRAWLIAGHRVRRWADEHGYRDAPWLVPDRWDPPVLGPEPDA